MLSPSELHERKHDTVYINETNPFETKQFQRGDEQHSNCCSTTVFYQKAVKVYVALLIGFYEKYKHLAAKKNKTRFRT